MRKERRFWHKIAALLLVCALVFIQVPFSVKADDTVTLPIKLNGTVYDCIVGLGDPVTSSGNTTIPSGGTVCFPLMFLGGDGVWYPVRANELQGVPGDQVSVAKTVASEDYMVGDGVWKTWADPYGDRYYIEYVVTSNRTADKAVDFSAALQKGTVTDTAKQFTGTVSGVPITLPISLGGTVYDCTVRLADPVTSSGSTTLPSGGTVCFALEFLGGDGVWYPVRANELQGLPGDQVTVVKTAVSGDTMAGDGVWKTWADTYGDRYYIEYTLTNNTTADAAVDFSAALQKGTVTDTAKQFTGTVSAGASAAPTTITLPIKLNGTVYDCIVDLKGYLTSSGSDSIPSGGTVCFPLMFQGGDGQWYPVLSGELQGQPGDTLSVDMTAVSGGTMLGTAAWKTWDNGHYYLEYAATNGTMQDAALEFAPTLLQGTLKGAAQTFSGTVSAGASAAPTTITLPIKLNGTVYDCIVDLQGYLTSSGSDTLPSGGTVCFPLMFLGGDGVWYPVLKEELQGTPDQYLQVTQTVNSGDFTLGTAAWKTWDNGHWFVEYTVSGEAETEVDFSAKIMGTAAHGTAQQFTGNLAVETSGGASGNISGEYMIAPIKIGGVTYDCYVDLSGYLTSSGSTTLPSGGTVCFPLMFMGADGVWYPVLKEELQGTPDQLFKVTYTASLGDGTLSGGQWKTWGNGHYFVEYKIEGGEKAQNITLSATLHQGEVSGTTQTFSGTVGAYVPIPQIPLGTGASLVIKRLEECKKFNTLSFTIADVRYEEQWPVDFETPNTTDAILVDGSIIKADLCFMVNGQWYPVRNNEVNESVEELLSYEFVILEGEECLGSPRLTTRLDTYGDIWEFEVPVKYAGENSDFKFTLCLVSADGTKVGSVYEVSGTVQDGNSEFIVTTEPGGSGNDDIPVLPIAIGGAAAALVLAMIIFLFKRKKQKEDHEA